MSTITRSSLADQHARGGPGFRRSDAPGLLHGPIDGKAFLAYLDQVVVPTGDVVEMNLQRIRGSLREQSSEWTLKRKTETTGNGKHSSDSIAESPAGGQPGGNVAK